MLLLTRRIGESIIIGEGENKIVVTVVSINGNQVRAGVEAPKSISVHREEVYWRIQGEKQAINYQDA